MRDPHAGESTVQEAIRKTLQTSPDLQTPEQTNRYLMRAIRNTAYSRFRGKHRERAPLPDTAAATTPTPLQQLLIAESADALDQMCDRALDILRQMPDPVRIAIELRFLHKPPLTLREIGERQGVPLTTAQGRVNAGLRTLAERLREPNAP